MGWRKRVKKRLKKYSSKVSNFFKNVDNQWKEGMSSIGDRGRRAWDQYEAGYRRYKNPIIQYGGTVIGAVAGGLLAPFTLGASIPVGMALGAAIGGTAATEGRKYRDTKKMEKEMEKQASAAAQNPYKRRVVGQSRQAGEGDVSYSTEEWSDGSGMQG